MFCLIAHSRYELPRNNGRGARMDFLRWNDLPKERQEERKNMIINVSLENSVVYRGCRIEKRGKRRILAMTMTEAEPIVRANLKEYVRSSPDSEGVVVGKMLPWVHMLAVDVLTAAQKKVAYYDGQEQVTISAQN